MGIKINLGCGSCYFTDGFVNVDARQNNSCLATERPDLAQANGCVSSDPYSMRIWSKRFPSCSDVSFHPVVVDIFCDITKIRERFIGGSVSEVWMVQVIEHFSKKEIEQILWDIFVLLEPGGKFIVSVPDIQETGRLLAIAESEGNADQVEFYTRHLYGSQKNVYAFHKWGFTESTLGELLLKSGFSSAHRRDNFHDYPAIVMEAIK